MKQSAMSRHIGTISVQEIWLLLAVLALVFPSCPHVEQVQIRKEYFCQSDEKTENFTLKEHGAANSFLRSILNLVHLNIWKVNIFFFNFVKICMTGSSQVCGGKHIAAVQSLSNNTTTGGYNRIGISDSGKLICKMLSDPCSTDPHAKQ